MRESIGIVEVTGSANAVAVVDIMLKTADVRFLSWETIFGVGRVTVFVEGDVAAVSAAVEQAVESPICEVFASYVIPRPHEETARLLERSAKKNKFLEIEEDLTNHHSLL